MSTVVKFQPVFDLPPAPPETLPQRRIRIASRGLAILFTVLLGASVLIFAIGLGAIIFYKGQYLRIGPDGCYIGGGPVNSVAFGSLPLPHRLIYVAVGVVRYAPVLMLFWYLRALFGFYAGGQVFSRGAGVTFSRIGGWLCAYAVSPLLCHLVLSSTGYEVDKVWLHMASVQAFILGLLVFVIGQVMQVGREIQEDREGFV
jgi:hypothetical protein